MSVMSAYMSRLNGASSSSSCLPSCGDGTTRETSLLDRVGGQDGLKAVVDSFVEKNADDPCIGRLFNGVSRPALAKKTRMMLEGLLGPNLGGSTVYSYSVQGVYRAHRHLQINDADFDVLIANIRETLYAAEGVDHSAVPDILACLAKFRDPCLGRGVWDD